MAADVRRARSRLNAPALAAIAVLAVFFPVAQARAASLQKVNTSEWGVAGLPSYVSMYLYVPDQLAARPPIVVGPHHCQGTGPGTFNEMSSLVSIANRVGFIMIFPEATGQNCWDAGSTRSLKHDGGGDTHAVAQMVRYTLSRYNGDASRVYSVGGSSGGVMTEALLGVYPDVFRAGVSLMGVACGCWAEGYNDITGTGNTAQWSGPCAGGNVTKTGAAWAALVRSYFPSYAGHRPRLQHWHGTADTILNYKNMAESTKEWTTLLGLSSTPTGTDSPRSGTTRQFWRNSCGSTVYEAFSMAGVGHAVPFDGNAVAVYFGLDKAGPDPEIDDCSRDGGPGENDGGDASTAGAGGTSGSGGSLGSGGASGGAGGAGATGGSGGTGGASGSDGASNGGGSANGGAGGSGGGVSGQPGSGGNSAPGGSSGTRGGNGQSTNVEPGSGEAGGCNCVLGSHARHARTSTVAILVAALAFTLRRRRSAPLRRKLR
jgi:acetylxylan esterase